jgi:sterol desaturase/sphingolipid hydroxylase (fatty acid hydroxylase superfamily)
MSPRRARTARRRSIALHTGVALGAVAAVALDRRLQRIRGAEVPLAVGVVATAWYGVVALAEQRHPYRAAWNEPRDDDVTADRAFMATTFAASLVSQPLGDAVARRSGVDLGLRRLPTPMAVAISVGLYDLAHTLMHRLGHEWGPAWKVHSVHHSPTRLYWLNATRFHLIETTVDGFIESALLGMLGMSRDQHIGHLAVRALYGQLQHCNVEVDSGPLDRVFSTPDLHRWHHSVDYDEGDTNYGAVTSVWDQLLGSFHRPAAPFEGTTGIGRMPEFPTSYAELQRAPFEWPEIRERNAETWWDGVRTAR